MVTRSRRTFLGLLGSAITLPLLAGCDPRTPASTSDAGLKTATGTSTRSQNLNVRDFGAKADGRTDDAPAFRAAIAALREQGSGATLNVPAGRYFLATTQEVAAPSIYTKAEGSADLARAGYRIHAHVPIAGVKEATIAGEPGATLVMRDPMASGIALERCEDVTVRDLTVDWETLPFSQGVIRAVNERERTFDWEADPGVPQPTEGFLRQGFTASNNRALGYGNIFTPDGELKFTAVHGADAGLDSMTDLGRRQFRVKSDVALRDTAVGDRFAWPSRVLGAGHAVSLTLCTRTTLERIVVHAAPMLAFAATDGDGLVFRACRIERAADGPLRLYSSNADGIHAKSNRQGPLIEGCSFLHHGDDSVTVVQSPQRVIAAASPTQLVVEFDQYQLFRPGDRISVVDQATGASRGESRVVDVTIVRAREGLARRLTLDQPVRGVVSLDSLGTPGFPARPAGHDRATPLTQRPDLVVDLDLLGSGAIVRDNLFARHRASGMRVYGNDILIEGNRFEHLGNHGVQGGMHLAWPEVYNPQRVTVRRNTFTGNSNQANVWFYALLGDHSLSRLTAAARDVTIEDNTFAGYGSRFRGPASAAVTVSNGEGFTVRRNRFGTPDRDSPSAEAVRLDRVRRATVEANTVSRTNRIAEPVVLSANADRPTVTLRGNARSD